MSIARRGFLLLAVLALAFLSIASFSPAAETKNISATPQAKAYQALLKAVAAGDFEAYKRSMTKAASAGIDKQTKEMGLDPKKGMELLKALAPTDLKYVSLNVDQKKATIMATGQVGGEMNKGTIELEEEDGQWKVANQSWTNAK